MGTEQRSQSLSTKTSLNLLEGLKNPDNHTIWREFVDRYRPMIISYARHSFGLGPEDAEDAAQQTLNAFFEGYIRKRAYDPQKGRLRKWLFGIATNVLRQHYRRKPEVLVNDSSSRTGLLARIPDQPELERKWDEEWRRAILKQSFEEIREQFDDQTVEAYLRFAEKDTPAEQVAKQLGMSRNAVYLAKHRVLQKLRTVLQQMEEIW